MTRNWCNRNQSGFQNQGEKNNNKQNNLNYNSQMTKNAYGRYDSRNAATQFPKPN